MRQDVEQAVRGYNVRSNWSILIRLCGKPSNVTIVQVCAPTTDAEKDQTESFYVSFQKEIDHTPKQGMLMGELELKSKEQTKTKRWKIWSKGQK